MRSAVLILLLAGCIPCANAQRSSAGPRFSSHFAGDHSSGRYSRAYGYAVPWLWDLFYGDDLGQPEASPPPERSSLPRILTAEPMTPASTAEPLLIELQGDRYVRLSDQDNSAANRLDVSTANPASTIANNAPPNPAVLIFRDGSRKEVSAYTISGGALYAQSDFYASGAWHQKIDLSTLDVPATIAGNQARGVRFQLPKAPNEVIVGP